LRDSNRFGSFYKNFNLNELTNSEHDRMNKFTIWTFIGVIFLSGFAVQNSYSDDWSFLGMADTRNGDGLQAALEWATRNLNQPEPAFLIHGGDLDPLPRTDDIITAYFGKPFFPTMGNHEKDDDRSYFYQSFYQAGRMPYLVDTTFIESQEGRALCYSFAYQNACFIVLDQYYNTPFRSQGEIDTEQMQWLEKQLLGNVYPYVFVIGHEPAYPKSWQRNFGDCLDRSPEDRDRFWELLVRYQVTAYLCGHTHSYLIQNIKNVWHIDMGQCLALDYHNKFLNFTVSDDSIQVRTYYPDGQLHDQFSLMPRNLSNPVELAHFSYRVKKDRVNLFWQTTMESTNYGFEVQKSVDQFNFDPIGFVSGHGTTEQPKKYKFTDHVQTPGCYYYRLKQIDYDGSFRFSTALEVTVTKIKFFRLAPNYPNPFNQETMIQYELDREAVISLNIFNLKGERTNVLVNSLENAGTHYVIWNGTDDAGNKLPSGIYLCKLSAGEEQETIKMLLTR